MSVPYGDLEAVEAAITPNTAAVLIEPIQGEAGVVIPPRGFLKGLEHLCTTQNVLLLADEIQSGLGRAGGLTASGREGVRADMIILGKALSGGFYPVSAVVAHKEILGLFKAGDHGSTYAGNPLGAAIAREALAIMLDENLIQRSRTLGEHALESLQKMRHPSIMEVRGRGLFIAIELSEPARPYCEALAQRGLLCKETHQNVIRFAPPLMIQEEELEWALAQFAAVFEEASVNKVLA